jgi:hypothetical protein
MNTEQTKNIISYLLGELPDEERDKIEDRLFTDEDFAELVDETESDLIDEYVRGQLNASQSSRFEQFFLLSEGRREKVKIAQILNRELFGAKPVTISENAEKLSFWESVTAFFRLSALNFAAAVLVLLAILAGGFLLFRSPKDNQIARGNENKDAPPLPSPVASPNISNSVNTNASQNLSVSNSNTNETNQNRPPKIQPKNSNINITPAPSVKDENRQITGPQQPTLAAILLTPMMRSDQSPILKIPANVKFARLQIVNSDQNVYKKLRLEVVSSNGSLVLRQEFDGKRKPKILSIDIATEKLASQDYEITLSGANADKNFKDLNYYRFSVQKK